ncbi:MAG: hypothetical protein PVG41_15955 [Desulfobacteraceae bacterium]|jgi:hypothetical protein
METFTQFKPLTENSLYPEQRRNCLTSLDIASLDAPIAEIVTGFNALAYCFTLQSCFGHFLFKGQTDEHNLAPLPSAKPIHAIEYRIAYIALCIENSSAGSTLIEALRQVVDIDPQNIQFGSAEWFWRRQVNSYALQVEPDRFKYQDRATLEYEEALIIEDVRNKFFARLDALLRNL